MLRFLAWGSYLVWDSRNQLALRSHGGWLPMDGMNFMVGYRFPIYFRKATTKLVVIWWILIWNWEETEFSHQICRIYFVYSILLKGRCSCKCTTICIYIHIHIYRIWRNAYLTKWSFGKLYSLDKAKVLCMKFGVRVSWIGTVFVISHLKQRSGGGLTTKMRWSYHKNGERLAKNLRSVWKTMVSSIDSSSWNQVFDEFASQLGLKPLEKRRLEKAGSACRMSRRQCPGRSVWGKMVLMWKDGTSRDWSILCVVYWSFVLYVCMYIYIYI